MIETEAIALSIFDWIIRSCKVQDTFLYLVFPWPSYLERLWAEFPQLLQSVTKSAKNKDRVFVKLDKHYTCMYFQLFENPLWKLYVDVFLCKWWHATLLSKIENKYIIILCNAFSQIHKLIAIVICITLMVKFWT